jgi:hypothetical protein
MQHVLLLQFNALLLRFQFNRPSGLLSGHIFATLSGSSDFFRFARTFKGFSGLKKRLKNP